MFAPFSKEFQDDESPFLKWIICSQKGNFITNIQGDDRFLLLRVEFDRRRKGAKDYFGKYSFFFVFPVRLLFIVLHSSQSNLFEVENI